METAKPFPSRMTLKMFRQEGRLRSVSRKIEATQLAVGLALSAVLVAILAGCEAGEVSGTGERVRLVITPAATPSPTKPAMPTAAPVTYVVKSGDTLWDIANLFGVELEEIIRANNITDPSALQEGQVLTIPGRSPTATPVPVPGAETPEIGATETITVTGSPTLPPPEATPPQGPPVDDPEVSSTPGPSDSPTVVP